MKISLEWLTDHLPGPLTGDEAAHALTHGGLPVEVIEKHGDDTVIDVEVTSNRGDCLCHAGIARELGALLNRPTVSVDPVVAEVTTPVASVTAVSIESPKLCPHYTARVIRGVKIGSSPDWMKQRLEAVGLRPINNVVDVTNYVMFEMGQPLHTFDFDKLEGRRIVVRNAKTNETLTSIDGHDRKLSADMLVIADAARPVALAGVMGGRDSEVSDSTVNVLLESARFDPLSVRTTARRLAMKSDSSYRFERGIDPTLPLRASLRAAQLILETAGGQLLAGVAQAGAETYPARKVELRLSRMKHLLGIEIPCAAAMDALTRLGLKPVHEGDIIRTEPPSWRGDINIEVDLIEEVARVVGYEKIPMRDQIEIRVAPPNPEAAAIDTIRSTLVGSGYFEAVTVTFISDLLANDFTPKNAKLPRTDPTVRKADAHLRPSMLPGLLEALRRNDFAGNSDVKLFEMGSTFLLNDRSAVVETRRLGLVGGQEIRDVRGAVELVLSRLDAGRKVAVLPAEHPGFARQSCGRIEWGGEPIGFLGKIDREVAGKLDLRHAPAAAEIDVAPLLKGFQPVALLRPLPKYPAVRRDLSLVMPEEVRFETIEKLVGSVSPQNLEALEYVGVYRGKPLEKGTKSQTISLVFRSDNQTLTSQAVDESVKKVIDAAQRQGYKLRD